MSASWCACGARTRTSSGHCQACLDFELEVDASPYDIGGEWVLCPGMIRRWRPVTDAEKRTRLLADLLAERYGPSGWWQRPDDDAVRAERLAAMVEDFDRLDARSDLRTADPCVAERILGGEWHMSCSPADKAEVCRRWVADGRPLKALERLTGWNATRYFKVKEAA